MYHAVSEQPDRNLVIAVNAFFHAFRWRWGFAEQIVQVCRQVRQETESKRQQEMAETLAAIYGADDQSDYELGIKKLEPLEALSGLTETARCETNALWADVCALGKYEEAILFFDRPSNSTRSMPGRLPVGRDLPADGRSTKRRWPTSTGPSDSTRSMPWRLPSGARLTG